MSAIKHLALCSVGSLQRYYRQVRCINCHLFLLFHHHHYYLYPSVFPRFKYTRRPPGSVINNTNRCGCRIRSSGEASRKSVRETFQFVRMDGTRLRCPGRNDGTAAASIALLIGPAGAAALRGRHLNLLLLHLLNGSVRGGPSRNPITR